MMLAAVVLAAGFGHAAATEGSARPTVGAASFGALPVTAQVPPRQWDRSVPEDEFVRQLYKEGRAVILYSTPADDWPAMETWSPECLRCSAAVY